MYGVSCRHSKLLVTLHFLCPSFYLTFPSPALEQHFPERSKWFFLCTTTSEGSFAELKIRSLITLLCWCFFIKYQSFSCRLCLSEKEVLGGMQKHCRNQLCSNWPFLTVSLLRFGKKWKEMLSWKKKMCCPDFCLYHGWLACWKITSIGWKTYEQCYILLAHFYHQARIDSLSRAAVLCWIHIPKSSIVDLNCTIIW